MLKPFRAQVWLEQGATAPCWIDLAALSLSAAALALRTLYGPNAVCTIVEVSDA